MNETSTQYPPPGAKWNLLDTVQKRRGSSWRGRVVGFYSTDHTPIGYNIESLFEPGSVQCWPEAALDAWKPDATQAPVVSEGAFGDSPLARYAQFRLDDASNRVKLAHEFSLAGIKTLVLINGGAIIALLTYLGNGHTKLAAGQLGAAFGWYVAGLIAAVTSYIMAYFSQNLAMVATMSEALRALGFRTDPDVETAKAKKMECFATACIWGAVVAAVTGLGAFVIGSWLGMSALT